MCTSQPRWADPGPSRPHPPALTLSGPNSFRGLHSLSLAVTCRQRDEAGRGVENPCPGVYPAVKAGCMCWAAGGEPLPLRAAPAAGPANLASEALLVFIPGLYLVLASPEAPASCLPDGPGGEEGCCVSHPWRRGSGERAVL